MKLLDISVLYIPFLLIPVIKASNKYTKDLGSQRTIIGITAICYDPEDVCNVIKPCKNEARCSPFHDNDNQPYKCHCYLGYGGVSCEEKLISLKVVAEPRKATLFVIQPKDPRWAAYIIELVNRRTAKTLPLKDNFFVVQKEVNVTEKILPLLDPGTSYSVRVKLVQNPQEPEKWIDEASFKTPVELKVEDIKERQAVLSVMTSNSSMWAGYDIELTNCKNLTTTTQFQGVAQPENVTKVKLTHLDPDTEYKVRVTPTKDDKQLKKWSNEITFETLGIDPSFTKAPKSVTYLVIGENITIECVATGAPKPTVKWTGSLLPLPEGRSHQQDGRLSINKAKISDSGNYTCKAENKRGVINTTTELVVLRPPGNCDFDRNLCGFSQDSDDKFDWTRQSGSTSTPNTGPSGDHTGGGRYMYIETSSPRVKNDNAKLSIMIALSGRSCLSFYYHMYGDTMGSLKVTVDGNSIFSKSGDKENQWFYFQALLSGTGNKKLVFEGIRGPGEAGDAAIDDVKFFDCRVSLKVEKTTPREAVLSVIKPKNSHWAAYIISLVNCRTTKTLEYRFIAQSGDTTKSTLPRLDPGKSYSVHVRPLSGFEEPEKWNDKASLETPVELKVEEIEERQAVLSVITSNSIMWAGYDIELTNRKNLTTTTQFQGVAQPENVTKVNLTHLDPNTKYRVLVTPTKDGKQLEQWSNEYSFETLGNYPLFTKAPKTVTYLVIGKNATIECVASGVPKPTVKWTGSLLPLPEGRSHQQDGRLSISKAQMDDSGNYTCTATSKLGVVSKTTELVVRSPESDRGTKENPGKSCKDILGARQGHAENGIFWIKFSWEADPFQVYCDMKSGGYTLAFKMVSGNNQDVLAAYKSTPPVNEHVVDAMSVTNKFKNHYKNRIILDANWKKFNLSYVKLVLYTGGVEKLAMKFNGTLSNYTNWFTAARLLNSPYTDVKTEPKNYFSISGHSRHKRSFFINRNYGNCGVDAGWFEMSGNVCYWEKRFLYPTVIFSKLKTYTNWNVHENVGFAEVMAVYVQ